MFRHPAYPRSTGRARLGASCCFGERATWSRPISARADLKFAPSKARPNLFSGD